MELVTVIVILSVLVVLCVVALIVSNERNKKEASKERDIWQKERAQLLDRIQAKDYNEYKAQERAGNVGIKKKPENPLSKEPYL